MRLSQISRFSNKRNLGVTSPPVSNQLFDPGSPWNTLIDPESSTTPASYLVNHGTITDDTVVNPDGVYDYSHPIYYATNSDPLYEIQVVHENYGSFYKNGSYVHIPAGATPAPGGDAHLTIIQPSDGIGDPDFNDCSVGFYSVTSMSGGIINASAGGYSNIYTGSGTDTGNTTAAGFNNAAGVITTEELTAGVIPHALFAITNCTCGTAVTPPAQSGTTAVVCGTDRFPSISCPVDMPPLGTRLWLNPNYSISSFPVSQQIILKALQNYGAIIGDTGMYSRNRIFGIQTESPESGGTTLTNLCEQFVLEGWAIKKNGPGGTEQWDLNFGKNVTWSSNLLIVDP